MENPFFLFVFVIAVGVGSQWLAARLRFPVILLLLTAGLIAGPGTGIVNPEQLLGDLLDPFISLAVAVVLFEGGLSLNVKAARHVEKALRRLILSGLVLGLGLTTILGHFVCGLDLATAGVLGAILVVTGPTVILPLLRGARISSRPATLLKWEGIVNDPLGALLALFVLKVAQRGDQAGAVPAFVESALRLVGTTLIAGVLGGLMGYLLHRVLDRHPARATATSGHT